MRSSLMTFFRRNCKIFVAIFVNSFADFYFPKRRPFLLPLHQRVISLPFPQPPKAPRKMNKKFFSIWQSRDVENNLMRAGLFTDGIQIYGVLATCLKRLDQTSCCGLQSISEASF
jgi:hypothetical protein